MKDRTPNRLLRTGAIAAALSAALFSAHTARGGNEPAPGIASYLRSELPGINTEFTGIYALSENGVAVGSVGISSPARWINGALDWYDEKLSGEATCVSDSGDWLGGSLEGSTIAFRKRGAEPLEELPPLQIDNAETINAYVSGIRGDGTAVGVCVTRAGKDLVEHAVHWSPEGEVEALLSGVASSAAYAINEAGTIVGALRREPGGQIRPFAITDGAVSDPAFGLDGDLAARAISANGNIVGSGFKKGFGDFWFLNRGGQLTFIPLQTDRGGSAPTGVNDAGLVVGNMLGEGAVAWLDGRFYPLDTLTPRSDKATLISARDVNSYAEIAANAYERVGRLGERFSANVLVPLRKGPDLQGSLDGLRVKLVRTGGRRFLTLTGSLRVLNAGSETARATVAQLTVTSRGSTRSRKRDRRVLQIPELAPDQSHSVDIRVAMLAPRRPANVQVTLDSNNRVLETNEANNLFEAPIE